ncbi:flavodoxin family protein [Arcanobacterium pinnipediorum]|uniref:NAD(P)H-dependent oxidoreductase n=1 Tax=Arcanobacterium pinnipediorum TaxID=1503041 RepID=A0ABY5AKR2_9ACTO|nr:NAD(P)H-dependent oxidoreductase [Arcanobacterium pinnipediorum]USR79844.1 NAD(P)H-dependent oxidoreductase [Arcanobacterium pinnipediorum]
MSNVLFILGSRNVESKQLAFARSLAGLLMKDGVDCEILTPNDWKLHSVKDGSVFVTGIDSADEIEEDSGKWLKEKLISCDLLVLGTPVYAHAVSADIKLLIERISGWLHIFRLLGKPGVSIVSASNNGFTEVQNYLEFIMESLGVELIEDVVLLDQQGRFDSQLRQVYEAIHRALMPGRKPRVGRIAEQQFTYYKRIFANRPRDLAEPRYWEERGWFDYDSLQQYLNSGGRSK